MTHYAIERWADFVRGLVPEPYRSEMEAHLGGGCDSCAPVVARLRNVVETARHDVDVPDAVVARAARLFVPRQQGGESLWRQVLAALTSDSEAALALEGVRSAGGGAHRLAFRAEDVTVELLVDRSGPRRAVAIAGQISMARGAAGTAALPVLLMSGRQVIQQTSTNESGEFHLESPSRANLRLCVRDGAGRREIEVPLGSVTGLRQTRSFGRKS